MRKLSGALLGCIFLLGLPACGDDDDSPPFGAGGEFGSGGIDDPGSGGSDGNTGGSGGTAGTGGSGGSGATAGTGGTGGGAQGTGGSGGAGGGAPGTGGTGGAGGGPPGTGGSGGTGGTNEDCLPGAICEGEFNYAFVTSTTQDGKLGGLGAADALCNDLADAAGLPGTYVAWLSDSSADIIERLGDASGWLRTDRRPFAASRSDVLGDPRVLYTLYPLILDENGDPTEATLAFTGTWDGGQKTPNNCSDWSENTAETAGAGVIGHSNRWSMIGYYPCSDERPLYCFGIDHSGGLPPHPRQSGRLAFVSDTPFSPGEGIARADEICQTDAEAANYRSHRGSTFKALLATSTESALSRFDLGGPTWVRPDGLPIWEDAADASNNEFFVPVSRKPDETYPFWPSSWLGAGSLSEIGTLESTCNDWRSSSASDRGRTIDHNETRLIPSSTECNRESQLICLEE